LLGSVGWKTPVVVIAASWRRRLGHCTAAVVVVVDDDVFADVARVNRRLAHLGAVTTATGRSSISSSQHLRAYQ